VSLISVHYVCMITCCQCDLYRDTTKVDKEMRVGNCYLDVLVRAGYPCSSWSVARSVVSSAALGIRWKSAARWPASDSVAIDRGSSMPVLGRSAYSVSVICSITRACRVGVGSKWASFKGDISTYQGFDHQTLFSKKHRRFDRRSPYLQRPMIVTGSGFTALLRW